MTDDTLNTPPGSCFSPWQTFVSPSYSRDGAGGPGVGGVRGAGVSDPGGVGGGAGVGGVGGGAGGSVGADGGVGEGPTVTSLSSLPTTCAPAFSHNTASYTSPPTAPASTATFIPPVRLPALELALRNPACTSPDVHAAGT